MSKSVKFADDNEPLISTTHKIDVEPFRSTSINEPGVQIASPKRVSTLISFVILSVGMSINHGAVVAILNLATATLGTELGNLSNGCLYGAYTVSAVVGIGIFLVRWARPKNGLLLGLFMYCVYCTTFIIASVVDDDAVRKIMAIGGGLLGGVAATVIWTALGTYLKRAAAKHAEETGMETTKANSIFAGIFGTCYTGLEVVTQLVATAITQAGGDDLMIFVVYFIIATIGMIAVFLFASEASDISDRASVKMSLFNGEDTEKRESLGSEIKTSLYGTAKLLLTEPRCSLMIFQNCAFGFTASYLSSYVNGVLTKDNLGGGQISNLIAVRSTASTLAAMPLAYVAARIGKGNVLSLGSLCCVAFGILLLAAPEWNWASIIWFYILQGLARATYESTNRALMSDFFPKSPQTEAIFSNVNLQFGGAQSLYFFLLISFDEPNFYVYSILFVSVSAIFATTLAVQLHKRLQRYQEENAVFDD